MRAHRGFMLLTAIAVLAMPARAAEWTVRAGESISAAIAHAQAGDRIRVLRGVYRENLLIDKPLTLVGDQRPTVDAGLQGDVLRISAPDVTVQGFILRNSGADLNAANAGIKVQKGADRARILNNDVNYCLFGIWVMGVQDAHVEGNLITGKRDVYSSQRGNGIQLYNTRGARIIGNHISFVRDGIYVDVSHKALFRGNRLHHLRYGTHYMNSYDNVWEYNESYLNRGGLALMEVKRQIVRHNKTWGNSDHGIMLRTIQNATVEHNTITGNARGIFIYDAEHNVLRNNLVADNNVGMHVWAGIINNKVDGNAFVNNRETLRYIANRNVFWGSERGNFWSGHTGWDRNGDGAGDQPFYVNDAMDKLLWRHPQTRLLLASPAVETLHRLARQFPVMRSASVIDPQPAMRPPAGAGAGPATQVPSDLGAHDARRGR